MNRGGIDSPWKAGKLVCEEGNASFYAMSLPGRTMLEHLVKILPGIRILEVSEVRCQVSSPGRVVQLWQDLHLGTTAAVPPSAGSLSVPGDSWGLGVCLWLGEGEVAFECTPRLASGLCSSNRSKISHSDPSEIQQRQEMATGVFWMGHLWQKP